MCCVYYIINIYGYMCVNVYEGNEFLIVNRSTCWHQSQPDAMLKEENRYLMMRE